MVNVQQIGEDTYWAGSSDRRLSRFENLFPLPHGVSYNCYLIRDEKTALLDTADVTVKSQFMENIVAALQGRKLDYLVLHHVEPDHCSQVQAVLDVYPDVTLVGNEKTFRILDQFFTGTKNCARKTVADGDVLELGKHKLQFVLTPMLHWPETMMSFDAVTGALFSGDVFGTFGAVDTGIFADECDFKTVFLDDSRRYYANIVGKYGVQAQAGLKKTAGLDIRMICPLHGPVWRSNIDWILQKYQKWTTWTPEEEGCTIVYGSMYGHTASAAEAAAAYIQKKSGKPVRVYDVSETHTSYLISEIWRFSRVLLFCPTYNGGIYPEMEALVRDIIALGVQNRIFGLAENGSWAPQAGKKIQKELEALKNCKVAEDILSFKGALHEADEERMQAWADAVMSATLS